MRRALAWMSTAILLTSLSLMAQVPTRTTVPNAVPVGPRRQGGDPGRAPNSAPSIGELNQTYARLAGTLRLAKNEIKNPAALELPEFATLKMQKQAADADAGQIMSAPGGGGAPAGVGRALSPSSGGMLRTAGLPAATPSQPNSPSRLSTSPGTICAGTAPVVSSVNRKQTGVIFTPDPSTNLYSITGCGFGITQGKLYLEGGPGAFPAHNGKLGFIIRTWNDRGIIAVLDPSIAGEFDQDNIKLVIETAQNTRGRLQSGPHRFIAARGEPVPIPVFPKSAFCTTPAAAMNQWCPATAPIGGAVVSPCGAWGLSDCSIEVFRQKPFVTPDQPQIDHYTPKLKPGFVISSVILQIAKFKPDDSTDVRTLTPVTVNANQVFIRVPVFVDPMPGTGYDSLYGVKFFAVGPKGITNPLVDGQ